MEKHRRVEAWKHMGQFTSQHKLSLHHMYSAYWSENNTWFSL